MSQPDWFSLMEQWKVRGMGQYGVTLPFLVGALGRSASQLLQEITTAPVPGYVTEVRWCAALNAPTFSVAKATGSKMHFESFVSGPDGEASLGFSKDLQSMFGLNCKGADDCLTKLAENAANPIQERHFSRNRNHKTNECEWGRYTANEVKFIKDVVGRVPKET